MPGNPRLRYGLEATPIEHNGQRMVLIADRFGYCPDSLIVSQSVAELLMYMNGENSLRDLQAHFMRRTGQLLYMEDLQDILNKLDEHLFLDNERFLQIAAKEAVRFRQDSVRRAQHAGACYPVEPDSLRHWLDSFFLPDEGPGIPRKGTGNRRLLGLVAPHIDLRSGGACFAYSYKAALEATSPDIWIVLGTGHEPVDNYFALTVKDFETPLGIVPCARECCEELLRRAPRDLLASEYNHRREHSVEFQAVFMAHSQPGAHIIPLLCSFSVEDWETDRSYIDEIALLLRDITERGGASVGIIASVDLAHIGPRYGDRFMPHSGTIAEHMAADRILLESLEKCDAAEFMGIMSRERNRRRVCGMAPLYMLAKSLEGKSHGILLQHRQTVVDEHNSFVTFASMAFYEKAAMNGK